MDFGTLLHVARKNNESTKNSEGKYYSTKFSAPKKEAKEKTLSDNIKKFLAKKEQEDQEKARIEKEKRDRLLALRDEKSKNKIKKMLKVIKSANKSVLDDAVDTENTAITLQGPDQPDEDDYGYVSNEAAAFYKKYMDKVKSLPDDNKFAQSRPNSRNDLNGTKDRVKAAIQKEQDEKNIPLKLKSSKPTQSTNATYSSSSSSSTVNLNSYSSRRKDVYDPAAEKDIEEKRREEERKQVKLKKTAPPPPLDFQQLLKLAEKKQYEPVEIVVETKKEPERLLTKKEKKELEERQKYLEDRERRKKEGKEVGQNKSQINGKIIKNGEPIKKLSLNEKNISSQKVSSSSSTSLSITPKDNRDSQKKSSASNAGQVQNQKISSISNASSNSKSSKLSADHKNNNLPMKDIKQKMQELSSNSYSGNSKPYNVSSSTNNSTKFSSKFNVPKSSTSSAKPAGALKSNYNGSTRQFPPKESPLPKKPLSNDIKPRQFPPPDVQRFKQSLPSSNGKNSRPMKKPQKRRIIDDDDEDEYDSEMDDFIDDDPEENDYSSYIKEIFGYDKSKYRYANEDDDDAAMESNFAQQMKEEYVSKKIGLMEDLEDMRLEAEEKKKKALIKKRKLK